MSTLLKALLVFSVLVSTQCQEEGAEVEDQELEEDALTADQLRRMHAKFDGNGDGKVSLQEVMDFSANVGKAIAQKDIGVIMEEIDTSKDGQLSLEEHLSDIHNQADGGDEGEMKELENRKAVETAKFKAADTNADGHLDKNELPALFYPETHEGVLSVSVEQTMRNKDTNKDGVLTVREFWESDSEGEDDLSEEEKADFAKLDMNGDGLLDVQELRAWESGRFHTEDAMKKLFEVADKDQDMHVTSDELADAKEMIAASDAQYHLIEWAEHNEL
jgi:Ca2+-binding EF-hand superfamily protein